MSDDSAVDRLLSFGPFELHAAARRDLFARAMQEAFAHHRAASPVFRRYCEAMGFAWPREGSPLHEYPFLPASLFKRTDLSSVPARDIVSVVRSSATTGVPSAVVIDRVTARRQALASARVMAAYLGDVRRRFLILDEAPPPGHSPDVSARSAATRGILVFAHDAEFFCRRSEEGLIVDHDLLARRLAAAADTGEPVCLFGFTAALYTEVVAPLLASGRQVRLGPGARVAHIGGWKRLADRQVDPPRFLDAIERALGVARSRVVDFYGFTEQMGLVYGSAGTDPKVVPAYAEIVVRDPDSLQPAVDGTPGLIQVLTPLPHSHPGISVLTEDVGRIVARDSDAGGMHGTRFEVLGRAPAAEPRGCGDLLRVVGTGD